MTLHVKAVLGDRGLDVDLSVERGETLALLGPNGAGKSSILAIVAGLVRPDRGSVELSGRALTRIEAGQPGAYVAPHARAVALLAQEPLLFPHLSVLDNVAFGPRSRGAARRSARQQARRWLEEVGVADLAERRPRQLSGGQAQRVAIARALAVDPEVLLLDEPMAALDVDVTPELRRTLRRLLTDRTVLIVTHDPLDALLLSDRAAVIEGGAVVEQGPTEQVLTRPRSAFAGRLAGLNLLAGTWDGAQLLLADGTPVQGQTTGRAPQEGERAAATFRPAAVAIYRETPPGSPRNTFRVTVDEIHPVGDLLRVRAGQLLADVTAHAVASLDLAPGSPVTFSVKAAEVAVYVM